MDLRWRTEIVPIERESISPVLLQSTSPVTAVVSSAGSPSGQPNVKPDPNYPAGVRRFEMPDSERFCVAGPQ